MVGFKNIAESFWFKPLRDAGTLSLGRIAQGLFSLGTAALAARALGVDVFGALVLIHSFVLAVSQLARFPSWQIILRYGAQALHDKNKAGVQNAFGFAILLDLIGIIAALVLVQAATGPATRLFGLDEAAVDMAALYGLAVVFVNMSAAPNGVLRLLDRFDLLAVQTAIEPSVRFFGSLALFFFAPSLPAFLMLWFGALVTGKIVLSALAWREMKRRDLLTGFGLSRRFFRAPEKGAWRFAFGTNIMAGLQLAGTQMPLLAVGWLLGPAAAGLFKVAQQFANILTKPASKLLIPAIYPALSHLSALGDHAARAHMVSRNAALAGAGALGIFILLALFGKFLLALLFGNAYENAYSVMLLLAAAGAVEVAAFSLEPLLVSAGKIRQSVIIRTTATILFAVLLYVLCGAYGLEGAGIAALSYALTSALLMLGVTRKCV